MNNSVQISPLMLTLWVTGILGFLAFGLIPNFPFFFPGCDKILHISAFMVLMLMPAMTLPQLRHVLACALVLMLCGVSLEVLQNFVPGRESSLQDMAANFTGIMAGLFLGSFTRKADFPLSLRTAKDL
jgi:hypothetical protein